MTTMEQKSKLLARWLRHRPDAIDLELDSRGWADVSDLLSKSAGTGTSIMRDELLQLVAANDKQRFSLSEDGARIRAAQGHSVDVDLKLAIKTPPPVLYHGTVERFLVAIRKQGLLPKRDETCICLLPRRLQKRSVRDGGPQLYSLSRHPVLRDGYRFRRSENGVWLIPSIPPKYLRFPDK